MTDAKPTHYHAPIILPEDPLEPCACYLYLRLDVLYALAAGVTAGQLREAFLSAQTQEEFEQALREALE